MKFRDKLARKTGEARISSWITTKITVGATATQLPATNLTGRDGVIIQNLHTSNKLFVGPANTVTIDTGATPGYLLEYKESLRLDCPDDVNAFGIANAAGTVVVVLEFKLDG